MLIIVHLVDSRKSYEELDKYVHSVTRLDGIEHWFVFGGNQNFDASIAEELIKPKDHAYIFRDDFNCTEVINEVIHSPAFKCHLNEIKEEFNENEIFINIRDMDDEYDDEQMLKETSIREGVGVIRFNHITKFCGVETDDRYGKFLGDYVINHFVDVKLAPKGIRNVYDAIFNEPHMIHRQFALINVSVIEAMASLYVRANKGEDTIFLANAYVTTFLLGMRIVVAGSVNIGTYNRNESQMSNGNDPFARFLQFTEAIRQGLANIWGALSSSSERFMVHARRLLSCIEYERCIGNSKSYFYHRSVDEN